MRIPASFTEAIAKAFYDKELTIRSVNIERDGSGYQSRTVGDTKATIKGSVRFDKLEVIKEEHGIDEDINMIVSVQPNPLVELLDLIQYNDITYEIVAVVPYDSSTIIGCKIWQP